MIALFVMRLAVLLTGVTGQNGDLRTWCVDRPWPGHARSTDDVRIADVPLESAVVFQCNYCGEQDQGEARLWYRSDRYTGGRRKEVALGMADVLESNRVYETVEHSLVLRNVSADDVARYSCSGPGAEERVEFALDAVPAGPGPAVSADSMSVGWAQYESRFLEPVVAEHPAQVWKMAVDWDAWGPCDGCASKRYRRAGCRVRFTDGDRAACRSIGLTAIRPEVAATLSRVPDFLLSEICYAYCQQRQMHRRSLKYRNTFVLAEGSSLTLACAEATADNKVTWRRDGLLLTDSNADDNVSGVMLDAFGTLYLVGVTVAETGNYTCYIDGNRTQEVLVAVRKSSLFASQVFVRHLYYLYYVFTLYFVVFSARVYYAFLKRHTFLKITENDVIESEIPSAYLGRKIQIR